MIKKTPIREKILRAAGDLLQRCGYACVGINRIIATAGVSKAGFYQNFESKENLCIEWLRDVHRQSEVRHREWLAEAGGVEEKVRRYFESLKDFMTCHDFRGCPYSNTAAVIDADSVKIRREVESHKIFIREFFVDLVRPVADDNAAMKLGNHLFLLYSGAATESQNLGCVWPIETARDIAVEVCEEHRNPTREAVAKKNALLSV